MGRELLETYTDTHTHRDVVHQKGWSLGTLEMCNINVGGHEGS